VTPVTINLAIACCPAPHRLPTPPPLRNATLCRHRICFTCRPSRLHLYAFSPLYMEYVAVPPIALNISLGFVCLLLPLLLLMPLTYYCLYRSRLLVVADTRVSNRSGGPIYAAFTKRTTSSDALRQHVLIYHCRYLVAHSYTAYWIAWDGGTVAAAWRLHERSYHCRVRYQPPVTCLSETTIFHVAWRQFAALSLAAATPRACEWQQYKHDA